VLVERRDRIVQAWLAGDAQDSGRQP
jgi:hypothetical protein